jgi:endonuclease YncB( thermonuclease family)
MVNRNSKIRILLRGVKMARLSAAFLLATTLPLATALAGDVGGTAEIIDAQTLIVGNKTIWLMEVVTPRPGDTCTYENRHIDCGHIAKTGLQDLTAGTTVNCDTKVEKSKGIWLGRCDAGGYDLSEGLIYTGWGRAAKNASPYLKKLESQSKAKRRGLWKGDFPASVNIAVSGD